MNITEYLKETHKTQYHERDNINLLRPVVNVLVGEYNKEEKDILVSTLRKRVGTSARMHYCKISSIDRQNETGIERLEFDTLNGIGQYEIQQWNTVRKEVAGSVLFEAIKDYAASVFNEAGDFAFESRGRIRLNFIARMDWVGMAAFESIVDCFNVEFGKFYENGVMMDVYCLLDQKAYTTEMHGDERNALNYRSLILVEQLIEKRSMSPAYVLSNYTSKNHFEPDFPIPQLRTIALHMIIKDGKTARTHSSLFSETNFMQEAKSRDGRLCTLGSMNLEVDEGTRNQVVYRNVFAELFNPKTENLQTAELVKRLGISEENIKRSTSSAKLHCSITPNQLFPLYLDKSIDSTRVLNVNCGDIIGEIFGNALDYYFENNLAITDESMGDDIISRMSGSFESELLNIYAETKYSLSEINGAMAAINETMNSLVDNYKGNLTAYKDAIEVWERTKYEGKNIQEIEKETGVPKVFYQIAIEYLKKKVGLEQNRLYDVIVEGCRERIGESVRFNLDQTRTFKNAIKDLDDEIDEKVNQNEKENDLKYGNISAYYNVLVKKWISANQSKYEKFVSELRKRISKNTIAGETIFEYVIEFCDENIINSPDFSNDIAQEMVYRLKDYKNYHTDDVIYGMAFTTIMDSKTFYADPIITGSLPYAVCFLVNPDNKFIDSSNEQMNTLLAQQKMSWFFEKAFTGMDILFMEGCFSSSQLYQYELYKGANERYEKEV